MTEENYELAPKEDLEINECYLVVKEREEFFSSDIESKDCVHYRKLEEGFETCALIGKPDKDNCRPDSKEKRWRMHFKLEYFKVKRNGKEIPSFKVIPKKIEKRYFCTGCGKKKVKRSFWSIGGTGRDSYICKVCHKKQLKRKENDKG